MQQAQHDQSIASIAEFISQHKDEIITRCVTVIRNSPDIPATDHLIAQQLIDHLPQLFDELAMLLQQADNQVMKDKVIETSREHEQHRWQNGYRFDELINEIAIVRAILLKEFFRAFVRSNPGIAADAKSRAKEIIHDFFNSLTVNSAKQYAEERAAEAHRYQAQLKAANERQQLLMRTVSHEMGNFLNAIVGAGTVLGQSSIDEQTRQKMLVIFKRNTIDMRQLLDQLLDYSVLLSGQAQHRAEAFHIQPHFADIIACFKPLVEAKSLQLNVNIDPQLDIVVCDRLMNKQIISNLLSNAIKYTHSGSITISVSLLDAEHYAVAVEDTGEGIGPEHLPHIFQEFHRISTNKNIRGTGLGLAITKRLVEFLGGRINVTSQLGKGSRFEVVFKRILNSDEWEGQNPSM